MMKTRSFLLAASVSLALAFTLSCSDDKDDPPKVEFACHTDSNPLGDNSSVCMELNVIPANMKDMPREQLCTMIGAKNEWTMAVRESCDSGQALKCPKSPGNSGLSLTVYVYGTLPDGFTCASMDDD